MAAAVAVCWCGVSEDVGAWVWLFGHLGGGFGGCCADWPAVSAEVLVAGLVAVRAAAAVPVLSA